MGRGGGSVVKIEATSSCLGRGHDNMYIHILILITLNIPIHYMSHRNFKKLGFNTVYV